MASFSEISQIILNDLTKEEKKSSGIFFTPYEITDYICDFVEHYAKTNNIQIKSILEPSCGSCQFIQSCLKHWNNIQITGIEKDSKIFGHILKTEFNTLCRLVNQDFLHFNNISSFDFICGNPPYFIVSKKSTDSRYHNFFTGRPNVYILFIIKIFNHMKNNSICAFVLPTNFLNSFYYDKLRKHIYEQYNILEICNNSTYCSNTAQETCTFIFSKETPSNNDNFTYKINNLHIFNTKQNISDIKTLTLNSKTLLDLNCSVSVGSVVWNKVKSQLTNDDSKTRLIYSSDICNGQVVKAEFKDESKKHFIDKTGTNEPMILINRGYGNGKYCFNYALYDSTIPVLIENHVMCVKHSLNSLKLLKDVIKSFENPFTLQFINTYFSNNAINCNELEQILPIYI